MTPRVSVLTTIYNAGAFLQPTLESLFAQTLGDFELIAIENGSRDGSRDVIRRFAKDSRVRLIEKDDNIGRVPALNLALGEAKADYVAILDADDIAHPGRLAAEVSALDGDTNTVIVGTHARFIDADGKVLGTQTPNTDPNHLLDALAYSNPFPHSSIMYRRQTALDRGGYNPRYPFANDLELTLALIERGRPAMIAEILTDVRYHASSMSSSPGHYYTRYDEIIDLFGKSLRRPSLSVEAKRRGAEHLAATHYVYGRELASARHSFAALSQFAQMVAADPMYCLRRGAVRARRLFASNGKSDRVSAR